MPILTGGSREDLSFCRAIFRLLRYCRRFQIFCSAPSRTEQVISRITSLCIHEVYTDLIAVALTSLQLQLQQQKQQQQQQQQQRHQQDHITLNTRIYVHTDLTTTTTMTTTSDLIAAALLLQR